MAVYDLAFPDGTPYPTIPLGTATVSVSTSAQLSTALSSAVAGHKIVLANGTYSGAFSMSGKLGTAANGISVEAATPGSAVFSSGTTFRVTNCAYVTWLGIAPTFDAAGDVFQFRGSSHHCRLTRATFGPSTHTESTDVSNWVYVGDDCYHVRIDHNALRNKGTSGNGVRVYGNFDKVDAGQGSSAGCRWVRIDHNSFKTIKPEVGNDKEPIRYGVSSMSRTIANGVIERNYFEECLCEPELISGKMGGLRITGNTIYRCAGGLVIRHGTNSLAADNYIIDRVSTTASGGLQSGGIRFYDADHRIAYNYVDGTIGANFQDPLLLDTGDAEGASDPGGGTPTQTLGVGGVATPAGAVLTTADSTSALNITTSGTASSPRVYDGQRHTVGRINVTASYVVVQNFKVVAGSQYGAYLDGSNITFQNNDIKGLTPTGDGDLNAITFFGNNTRLLYNTAINFVSGAPGDSHTDFAQTWVSSSHSTASSNVEIRGNKATGPSNPSRSNSVASIHQCVMAEDYGRGGNSGGSTSGMKNWVIADNTFSGSWNQELKLDGVDDVSITRNTFAGSSDKQVDLGDGASNVKYYSDNVTTGSYGSIGISVTTGSGPA